MVLPMAMAAVQFTSSFLSSMQQHNQYKQQARQYAAQAKMYRQNAANTRLVGSLNEDTMRSQKRATLAGGRAAMGEAGMGYSPTATSSLATTASALEQNVLNARYETESEASNYIYQANVADANARAMRKRGSNAFLKSLLQASSAGMSAYFGAKEPTAPGQTTGNGK